MGEGVEVLGYVGHNRSFIWSDITYILNIKKRLVFSDKREKEGWRRTVMSIFSAASKASSKFRRWLWRWRELYCNKSGRYRSISAQLLSLSSGVGYTMQDHRTNYY